MTAAESIVNQVKEIREGMAAKNGIGHAHAKESKEIFGDLVTNESIHQFVNIGFERAKAHGDTTEAHMAVALNFMRMGYKAALDELKGGTDAI